MPRKQLTIEINNGAVRFTKLDGSFVISEHNFTFVDRQDYRYKAQLEEFIQQERLRELDFDEYSLGWSGIQSTLVPTNVFNESTATDIFNLCYGGKEDHNEIDYNRLPELNVVNVHGIPLWVKSFFVIKFPRIVIQHEGSHVLRGVFNGSTFNLNATLVVHNNYFQLICVKDNMVQFYSSFECNSIEDIIYYFAFTAQQKEWAGQFKQITLTNGAGSPYNLEDLKQNILRLKEFSNSTITIDQQLISKFQLLCA